ncbi:MAG: translation initiation factor IF-2 [Cytophagales bacterium]
MSEEKFERLSKVARELNVALQRAVDFLNTKGAKLRMDPNAKISDEQVGLLRKEFGSDIKDKKEASAVHIGRKTEDYISEHSKPYQKPQEQEIFIRSSNTSSKPEESIFKTPVNEPELIERHTHTLAGPKVVGKIELTPKRAEQSQQPKPQVIQQVEVAKPVEAAEKIEQKPIDHKPIEEESPKVEVIANEEPKAEKSVVEENAQTPTAAIIETEIEAPIVPAANVSANITDEIPTELIEAKAETLKGLTVLGKMELAPERPAKAKEPFKYDRDNNKKRKRIEKKPEKPAADGTPPKPFVPYNKDNANRPNNGAGTGNTGNNRPNTGTGNTGGNRPNANSGAGGNRPNGGNAGGNRPNTGAGNRDVRPVKEEITDKQIQEQIKNTLARLSGNTGNKQGVNRAKYRKDKRSAFNDAKEERLLQEEAEAQILKVTEFISANDLASLMNVAVTQVISACMSLGMFVSINQRLDAETISIISDEFGFAAQFISAEEEITAVEEVADAPEDLETRPPIVTIMGHVDHGKTSLLDYIRKTSVTTGEAGGITQHIGAYDVITDGGKKITFLDTPGHEAFTAMRARGAKVTDIVIIVIAADDGIMPQTKEALNHAMNAGVPIIIAINKIDKPAANPERIKEQLANENILVEDWGGKYQCEGVSAKSGIGIPELLEKILLEAELLELTANPNKKASGTVIEAELDKGRGYVTTLLVQAGSFKQGDIILAGQHFGRIKAMYDHLGNRVKEAGPSKPVQILGLPGAPQSGDRFNVMETEAEAREIATKREQIHREQSMRTKKHITLDEIGRRLAIGTFKQLNVIVKGDFDGSVEALTDSLLKLSTNEIQVSVIHKGVGQISESDVLLASAADAVIVGFQVRPSQSARKLAEQEEIEIRLYSIIYDAINELKDAMEGMLAPTIEETIMGTVEVREVFKITKVGTIAGCMVIDGSIKRQSELRVIRDGIVVHTGKFASLKRYKDDIAEVKQGMDCGIGIYNFNNVEMGDTIEVFEKKEVKRKL